MGEPVIRIEKVTRTFVIGDVQVHDRSEDLIPHLFLQRAALNEIA